MSKSGVTEWHAHVIVEAVTDEVELRMEDAAKVVEVDARHRLLSIREPEFGQGYRRVLALFRLTSHVERRRDSIIGRIGIPRGDKGDSYGWWIEVGSKVAAAHPWLRPALWENLVTIRELLGVE